MSETNGAVLWIKNFTSADSASFEPWTRTQMQIFDGLWVQVNQDNDAVIAVNANSGTIAWQATLPPGINSNGYDVFNIRTYNGLGCLIVVGFGGDIWCVNETNGKTIWQTSTVEILGNPGLETPYATWPLWVFLCDCITNNVGYFAVGHEYNPPLFHGAQLLAINMTNGNCIWHELDFSVESTEISYGIVLSRNAYDNQIYAFGKGPSETTVTAPDIGVTTATPVTITGTVMDISPGTKQSAVALNYPLGVPCVSDASESHFMESVYQQQPMPNNVTGVPVTLTETDHNGNTYTIGTTTTDSSGTFAYNWTPPIEGNYTIVATFGGSNSYYGSCAETHIYANAPPATAAPTASPVTGLASTSTVELGIAVLAIIVIIGIAVLAMLMVRKHP
jgi:outer membrane protein assembly factor BamB